MIQNQVKLPVKVALDVVFQGIRIRFGRSVVTVMGVMLGIAFLMAILAGQSMKRGVRAEDRLRREAARMFNLLTAETGPPAKKKMGLLLLGGLNPAEEKLLLKLEAEGLEELVWHSPSGEALPQAFRRLRPRQAPLEETGKDAAAVLLAGGSRAPELPYGRILKEARQPVLGLTRAGCQVEPIPGVITASLESPVTPEEAVRAEAIRRKENFRSIWIIIISLCVTVMGISNALLMSVTERFREIGTMKCLGALSAFVRTMFLIESGLIGVAGGLLGCLAGMVFSFIAYGFTYGFPLVALSLRSEFLPLAASMFACLAAGVVLSILAAIYPAQVASSMVPAAALRSNV